MMEPPKPDMEQGAAEPDVEQGEIRWQYESLERTGPMGNTIQWVDFQWVASAQIEDAYLDGEEGIEFPDGSFVVFGTAMKFCVAGGRPGLALTSLYVRRVRVLAGE